MPRTKDKTNEALKKAKAAGKYMVAVWSIEDGQLNLFRLTEQFPLADLPLALKMLQDNLKTLEADQVQ